MSHSHWHLLELDPVSATTKDVKRSYARRLKICRPDHDPEGFQNLHRAYTSALVELESRKSPHPIAFTQEIQAAHSAPSTASPTSADIPLQAAFHASDRSPGRTAIINAFDDLSLSLSTPGDDITIRLREVESSLYLHPNEVIFWGESMSRIIRQNPDREDIRFKPEAFLFELENDGCAGILAEIERLELQARHESIRAYAYLFQCNESRISSPAGGLAAYRLACAAAMWEPSFIRQLADFAYKNLPVTERRSYMIQLDLIQSQASSYGHIPDFCKRFWIGRLQNPHHLHSWDSQESQDAIRVLKSRDARFWPCFLELVRLLPENLSDEIMASHKLPALASDPNPELTLYKKNNLHLSGPAWTRILPKSISSNHFFLWFVWMLSKPFKLIIEALNSLNLGYGSILILIFIIKAVALTRCHSE